MVSRFFLALSYKNIEKYQETTTFLNEAIDLFSNMKVGKNGHWKPFQSALILSTKTVLELSCYLLENGFSFFLPCRLTQDCLENLFSVMRLKNVIPNALQFKNNLKLITISQYMKSVRGSNYDEDDREHLSQFLNVLLQNRSTSSHFISDDSRKEIIIPNIERQISFNKEELNVLYYIGGYIISNIQKNQKVCQKCINSTKSSKMLFNSFSLLTRIKSCKQKCCIFMNEPTFNFFVQMENIFRIYYKYVLLKKII